MSETTAESAESLAAKAAEIDTSAPPPTTEPPPAPTLAEAAAEVRLAQGAPEDEVVQEEDYKQKALQLYGSLREKVVTYASTGAEYVRERLPDQVPERQRVIAMAQKGATIVASLGLRVASVAATGSARLQADEESVENAEKLVRDLAEQFDAADARLRADALKLKATWDDLQLQALRRVRARRGVAGRHGARGGGRRGAFPGPPEARRLPRVDGLSSRRFPSPVTPRVPMNRLAQASSSGGCGGTPRCACCDGVGAAATA